MAGGGGGFQDTKVERGRGNITLEIERRVGRGRRGALGAVSLRAGFEGKKAVAEMGKVGGARLWSPWCWVKAKDGRDSFHSMYFTLMVPDVLVCPI